MIAVWNGPIFRKPRLPKTLSWVIGVERLSERFADIPQFNNLKVWFDDHPIEGRCQITVTKAVSEKMPQQILTVWYAAGGDAQWYFMVYPVEAKSRSRARQLLEEQAFPIVERWMKTQRSEIWLRRDKHLRCVWNRVDDQIEIKEELR